MPAAIDISAAERDERAEQLAAAIAATGKSRRDVASILAMKRGVKPATMETNLKRWSGPAREKAIDAAPEWVFDEIAKIGEAPSSVISALRDGIERQFIAVSTARRAVAIIERLAKANPGQRHR